MGQMMRATWCPVQPHGSKEWDSLSLTRAGTMNRSLLHTLHTSPISLLNLAYSLPVHIHNRPSCRQPEGIPSLTLTLRSPRSLDGNNDSP